MRRRAARLPDMSFRACGGEYFADSNGLRWRVFEDRDGAWFAEALDPDTGLVGNVLNEGRRAACRTAGDAMLACAQTARRPGWRFVACCARQG